jgi:DNA-binding MarR family transcriptional regulator
MDLQTFFPYRLALLAERVSQATAQVYAQRFDLTRDEWRIVATLAGQSDLKTSDVIGRASLDKMRVSRAVQRLERRGLVARTADPDDGRGHLLRLSPEGRALHRRIVPMVKAREAFLLEALSEKEREALARSMDKVLERAEQLMQQG